MDAEIDSEADEQDREGYGDQVQLTDHADREARGPRQADEQRKGGRLDQSDRTQPDDQQRHDDAERKEIGDADALLDALQLLFHHHRLSGETNPDAVLGREPQLRGRRADQGDGSLRRLQRIEVEQRLEQQILSRAGETWIGVPGERASPREAGGMAGRDLLHRPGDVLQRHLELPRQAAVGGARTVDIAQRQRQHLREAAQARVLRQRREQRLSAGHHTAEGLQLLDRQEEQAVPAEKRIRFGMKGVTDHVGTLRQPLREPFGGRSRLFRRVAVDDDDDGAVVLRESAVELIEVPPEGQVLRQHVGGRCVDGDVLRRIGARQHGGDERERENGDAVPAHEPGPGGQPQDRGAAPADLAGGGARLAGRHERGLATATRRGRAACFSARAACSESRGVAPGHMLGEGAVRDA